MFFGYSLLLLISGDENCECLHWRECRWSNAAVYSVKDVAKESEEFNQVQTIIQQNACGNDPVNHFVNCCGPDQEPSEITTNIVQFLNDGN